MAKQTIHTIYRATNTITGKTYTGYTSLAPRIRWSGHKHTGVTNEVNTPIGRAIRKYGWDAFVWDVIYQSLDGEHTLGVMENHFIVENRSHVSEGGYNVSWGGDATGLGLTYWNNGQETIRRSECPGDGWSEGSLCETNKGKKTWNNGVEERLFEEPPIDEDWNIGRLPEVGERLRDTTWWNNGTEQQQASECPGENWVPGMLPGISAREGWWNNGYEQIRSVGSPGEGWRKGELHKNKSGYRWYHKGGVRKKFYEPPGDGWALGEPPKSSDVKVKFWNDGTQSTTAAECPGEGWNLGPLKSDVEKRTKVQNKLRKKRKENPA